MENKKEYIDLLKSYFNYFYASIKKSYHFDKNQYKAFCKQKSEDLKLKAKDFDIISGHTIEEYFDKYEKHFSKGKSLVHLEEELFLLNKKRKYWKIPNETDALYFEIPSKKKMVVAFLLLFALVGGATGTTTYFLIPRPQYTTATVELDEQSERDYPGYSLSIDDSTPIINEDFDTDITLKGPAYFFNADTPALHAKPESVTSNQEELSVDDYEYRTINEDRTKAHIHIPAKYVTGPINIKIKLISADYFCCRSTASGDVFYEGDGLVLQDALDDVMEDEIITILKPWTYGSNTRFVGLDSPTRSGAYPTHFTLDGNYQKLISSSDDGKNFPLMQFVTTDDGSSETERHNCCVDIKNLDIETTGYKYSLSYDGDVLTITSGTMTNCKISSDQTCLFISGNDYGDSDVHLYDCEFTHRVDGTHTHPMHNSVIAPQYDGRVTIHSGTYTSTDTGFGVRVLDTGGIANIEGGTIKAGTALYVQFNHSYSEYHNYSDINAYHGTIIGDVTEASNGGRDEERIQLRYDVVVEGTIGPGVEDLRPN